jgi:hypothetical protein
MEEAMSEKPQPDRVPDEPPPHPLEPLQIAKPVIDSAKKDADALASLKQIEELLRGQQLA